MGGKSPKGGGPLGGVKAGGKSPKRGKYLVLLGVKSPRVRKGKSPRVRRGKSSKGGKSPKLEPKA